MYKDIVNKYRKEIFHGKSFDFVPVTKEDLKYIVFLRNQEKVKTMLSQDIVVDINSQIKWYDKYLERDNDIYFIYQDKDGNRYGAVRIYDITENKCEIGSSVADLTIQNVAMKFYYAHKELIEFAFNKLNIIKITDIVKDDNDFVNKMNESLGYKHTGYTIVNGRKYKTYILEKRNI